jgi:hypothetical protein
MSAERIRLVRNDTKPQIKLTILDEITGDPVDLSGAQVHFHLRVAGRGSAVVVKEALVISAVDGEAQVVWEPGDLDLHAGQYEAEVQVTYPSGHIQTVFDTLRIQVREEFA